MKYYHMASAMGAISLSALLPVAHAQSNVTLFGVMDLAIRQTNVGGGGSVNSLASGGIAGSRIGLRGTEQLGDGWSTSFWLEADIAADTGTANPTAFWSRRSTLAIANSRLGELRLGRDYVPLFSRQYVVFSPFGPNGVASNGGMFFGAPSLLGSGSGASVRADNMIKYVLPSGLGGFYGEFMVSAAEGRSANRHRGAVMGYAQGSWIVNAGFGNTDDAPGVDSIRLRTFGASYDAGWAKFTTLVQRATYRARRQNTMDVGVAVPVAAGTLKASLIRADQSGAGTDANDANQLSLGYVYPMSKRTTLYGTYSRIDNKGTQSFGLGGVVPPAGRDMRGIEFGLNHTF